MSCCNLCISHISSSNEVLATALDLAEIVLTVLTSRIFSATAASHSKSSSEIEVKIPFM